MFPVPPNLNRDPGDEDDGEDTRRYFMGLEVLAWRYQELSRAGYPPALAISLAESDVDLHTACELVGRGCAPEQAVEILA